MIQDELESVAQYAMRTAEGITKTIKKSIRTPEEYEMSQDEIDHVMVLLFEQQFWISVIHEAFQLKTLANHLRL